MERIKVTHIFLGGGEQWCSNLVQMFGGNFTPENNYFEHTFVCTKNDFPTNDLVIKDSNIELGKIKNNISFLYKYAEKADYIFLYNNLLSVIDRAFIKKSILNKIVWLSFGSDLNVEHEGGWNGNNIISKLFHLLILPLIEKKSRKKMSKIHCICSADLFNGYSIRKDYGNVKIYPFGFCRDTPLETSTASSTNNNSTRFLVGHHGYPGVNHIKVLDLLSRFKEENIEIVLPLSYGDPNYIKNVSEYATKVFGSKAIIMNKKMNYTEYEKLIASIDVAIFDTKKLIAQDNINLLLKYGKKIYTPRDGKIYEKTMLCTSQLNDIKDIKTCSFDELKSKPKNTSFLMGYNKRIVFTKEEYIESVRIMLSELYKDYCDSNQLLRHNNNI